LLAYSAYVELTEPIVTFEVTDCIKQIYFTRYYEAQVEIENFNGNKGIVTFLIVCISFLGGLLVILVIIRITCMGKKVETEELIN